jgi:RNA polymerase sigma-70 factor (ECF subfamily)
MLSPYSKYSDSELFTLLSTDEAEGAFSELYSRLSPSVYAYVMRIMRDHDAAADVFQETFTRLYNSAQQRASLDNVKGYIITIARNLCMNERKRSTRLDMVKFEEEMYMTPVSRNLEEREMLNLIQRALDQLSHDQREAFVLREYEGLPYNEICALLNLPLDTVKVRVFRARQRIKAILDPYINDMPKDEA